MGMQCGHTVARPERTDTVRSSRSDLTRSLQRRNFMRKIAMTMLAGTILGFGVQASSAADLPMKAAPYAAPVAAFSWTGWYFGAHAGAGWGTSESSWTGATVGGGACPAALLPIA